MAVFEADTVNALAFFRRVFGPPTAGPEVRREVYLEPGGAAVPPCGERFFSASPLREIEGLYLNLCFLEELSRAVFPRLPLLRPPDLAAGLGEIILSLDRRQARVPELWRFTIEWIGSGAGGDPDLGVAIPDQPPFYGYFFLGTIQCAALMAHRRSSTPVLAAVVQSIARPREDTGESSVLYQFHRFDIEGNEEMWPEPSLAVFRQAFQLGMELVAAGLHGRRLPRESLFERIHGIKAIAWKHLFDIERPVRTVSRGSHDPDIHALLERVLARWRSAVNLSDALENQPEEAGADAFPETVVLSPDGEGAADRPVPGEAGEIGADAFPETVVLPPGGEGAADRSVPGEAGEIGADAFPETVVLPPGGEGAVHPSRPAAAEAGGASTPSNGRGGASAAPFSPKKKGPPPPPGHADRRRHERPRREEGASEDDIILETVIIRPGESDEEEREA